MTNVTPHVTNPVTDKQMAAALVLADILDHGLPPASWSIAAHDPGVLVAQVIRFGAPQAETDAEEREVVQAFAEFLGTDVFEDRGDSNWTLIEAVGIYEGVQVRVWANVDDDDKTAKEAAALAAAAAAKAAREVVTP